MIASRPIDRLSHLSDGIAIPLEKAGASLLHGARGGLASHLFMFMMLLFVGSAALMILGIGTRL